MGKEKKKLKIKTSRYFTKTCSACSEEFPNWFVSCPACGTAWDDAPKTVAVTEEDTTKKTIKIVVKITEDDFDEKIHRVQLIFSADQGINWYQMQMDSKMDYFIAEIADVPTGSVVIYYIDVYLVNGEKVTENNEGKFFYYQVGVPVTEIKVEPSKEETEVIEEHVKEIPANFTPKEFPKERKDDGDVTIFGRPQTAVDPNLKVCPHCQSKIKVMWTVCPICGKPVQ